MRVNFDNINRWKPAQLIRCLERVGGRSPNREHVAGHRYYWLETACYDIWDHIRRHGMACNLKSAGNLYEGNW